MKKLLIIVAVSCWALGAAMPALAGPDFNAIQQARKARDASKQADQVKRDGDVAPTAVRCPPDELVLQLDHGPRAQTTPYANRLRTERHAAKVQACRDAGKPFKATK